VLLANNKLVAFDWLIDRRVFYWTEIAFNGFVVFRFRGTKNVQWSYHQYSSTSNQMFAAGFFSFYMQVGFVSLIGGLNNFVLG